MFNLRGKQLVELILAILIRIFKKSRSEKKIETPSHVNCVSSIWSTQDCSVSFFSQFGIARVSCFTPFGGGLAKLNSGGEHVLLISQQRFLVLKCLTQRFVHGEDTNENSCEWELILRCALPNNKRHNFRVICYSASFSQLWFPKPNLLKILELKTQSKRK